MADSKDTTAAMLWEGFRSAVVHPDAPPSQIYEMRLAFYAGIHSMLRLQLNVIGEDSCSEDEGAAIMQRIHEECMAFGSDNNGR